VNDDEEVYLSINTRPYNLVEDRAIRNLDPNDVERLVQVDGMITRVSNVTPDMRCAPAITLCTT
jgi:DNA replication licensing factor MCM4